MKRMLSPWCKEAQKAMIDKEISVTELAEMIGKSRPFTSAVINGRSYSEPTVKQISDVLNISETACSLGGN